MILSVRVVRQMSPAGLRYWIAGSESRRRDNYLTCAKCASDRDARARYVRLARAAHHAYLRAIANAVAVEREREERIT